MAKRCALALDNHRPRARGPWTASNGPKSPADDGHGLFRGSVLPVILRSDRHILNLPS
jgi:hypothetical protein